MLIYSVKYKLIMITKTHNIKPKKWLALFLFCSFIIISYSAQAFAQSTLSPGSASGSLNAGGYVLTPSYVNVNKDWDFKYNPTNNIIIAQKGDKVAVYQNSDIGWEQRPDYYNQGGETFSCGSHIVKTSGGGGNANPNGGVTAPTSDSYRLYEGDKGGCTDDQYHENNVAVTEAKNIDAAAKINYGNPPVGCKGFNGTPAAGANYACPGGKGGVVEGVYKADGADAANAAALKAAAEAVKPANDSGSQSSSGDTCLDSAGVFGWVICEVADKVDAFANNVEKMLQDLLRINNLSDSSGLYDGWKLIKNLASIFIVLFALIIIASQIFGFEFLSAYTVKKAIPRLFIAVIALQLSWFLAISLVSIANAIGDGIQALLLLPFKDLGTAIHNGNAISEIMKQFTSSTGGGTSGDIGTGGILLVAAGTAGFMAVGGLGGLVMGIIIIGLAVLVAFVTLVLRVIIVWGLVVIMPLAIVAWVLPATQKYWDQWWGTFWKLLFMYPLIIGLLTIGKIGAYLAAQAGTGGIDANGVTGMLQLTHFATIKPIFIFAVSGTAVVTFLIIIIAYFGPYFLIPSSFKFGGTLFAKASGAMQGMGSKWGRKAGEGSKKGLQGAAGRYQRNHNNKFSRGLNNAMTGAVLPGQRANSALSAKKALEERSSQRAALMEQQMNGMSHLQKVDYLSKKASAGDEYEAEIAIEQLYGMNEAGEVRKAINAMNTNKAGSGSSRLHSISNKNTKVAGETWTKLRDMADGGEASLSGMSAQQWAGQDDSVWQRMNDKNLDVMAASGLTAGTTAYDEKKANFDRQMQNIQDTPTLKAAIKGGGQKFLNDNYSSRPGGPSGGPAGPGRINYTNSGRPANAQQIQQDLSGIGGDVRTGTRQLNDQELEDLWSHARNEKWHKDRGGATTNAERQVASEVAQEMSRRGLL